WVKCPSQRMRSSDGILLGNINYLNGRGGWGVLIYSQQGGATPGAASAEMFTSGGERFYRVTGQTNLCDNVWHNMIVTYHFFPGFKIFIDGRQEPLVVESKRPGRYFYSAYPFGLGNAVNKGNTLVNAKLANVQFWNIALSPDMAQQIASG